MNKTITLQTYLALFAFYGLANVIYTELSGRGLYSMFKPVQHSNADGALITTATSSNSPVIVISVRITPRRRRCFKYFTVTDGTWIETRIHGSEEIS